MRSLYLLALFPALLLGQLQTVNNETMPTARVKINANFTYLQGQIDGVTGENLGAGVSFFKQRSLLKLQFKTLSSANNRLAIAANGDGNLIDFTINEANFVLSNLGGSLNWSQIANVSSQNPVFNTLVSQPATDVDNFIARVVAGHTAYAYAVRDSSTSALIWGITKSGALAGAIKNMSLDSMTVNATGAGAPVIGRTHASTVAGDPFFGVQTAGGTWRGGFLGDGKYNNPDQLSGAAVFDANGTLQKASGTATNCVLVDGSNAPCGSGSGEFVTDGLGILITGTGTSGDPKAIAVNTAVVETKNAASTYTAGAKKTFQSSATTAGSNVACAALPSSPATGDIACDSADGNKLKQWNGSAWVVMGGGTGTGDALIATLQSGSYEYAASTTGTDAYVVSPTGCSTTLTAGMEVRFSVDTANTDGATLDYCGSGNALALNAANAGVLVTGHVIAGPIYTARYNGTYWRMITSGNCTTNQFARGISGHGSPICNILTPTPEAYGAGWNGDTEAASRDDAYDRFEAIAPSGAAQGTLMYMGAAGWTSLTPGTSGHYLQTQGAGANPQWAAAPASPGDTLSLGVNASSSGYLILNSSSSGNGTAFGAGNWWSDAVSYVRPVGANKRGAFDVMTNGTADEAHIDICGNDIVSDSTNWQCLELIKARDGEAGVSAKASGTGTVKDLRLQAYGGRVMFGNINNSGSNGVSQMFYEAGTSQFTIWNNNQNSAGFFMGSGGVQFYNYANAGFGWYTNNNSTPKMSLSAAGVLAVPGGATLAGGVTATGTVYSGTKALDTDAIASGACDTMTQAATGVASTDTVSWTFNADVTAVTGYAPVTTGGLSIYIWPTTDTINIKACNPTSSSITPGPVSLNLGVRR
jgi:hypothetical protein